MVRQSTSQDPGNRRIRLLRAADQCTVAALVATCFVAILLHWFWHAASGPQLIEIDRAEPLSVDFQIDLNQADWPELTLLPRIGETLAKRIVAYRDTHGPFESIERIQDVKGIGPKTLRRIRPMLGNIEQKKRSKK